MKCPKCCGLMTSGFSAACSPISWITKEQFRSFVFVSQDLANVGRKLFLPSIAEYFTASHCIACQIIITDYSTRMDRRTVESMIDSAYRFA